MRACRIAMFATPARTECLLTVDNYVASIVFARPSRKNALGKVMLKELQDNVRLCHNNPAVRCVILSSAVDGVFCAGADLKERKEMTKEQAFEFVCGLRDTFTELEKLSVPCIAAIEGGALGGGLEIALAADLRVAGAKASLGVPETALAIIPGAGGTQRLTKTIGLPRAKEMVFTAKPVTAARAAEIGLVNYAVDAGRALERAQEIASQISANGPIAVAAAKEAINGGWGHPTDVGMAVERKCYDRVLVTEDRLEGLKAFAEKRKPVYHGK